MNYIITGMKHCGKSTMGEAWAEHLNCPFYDTDEMVLDLYRSRGGEHASIREMFIEHGREHLKRLEKEVMHILKDEVLPNSEHNVVSLGGGLPINSELVPLIKSLGVVVYLEDSCEALFERVMASGNVPFLSNDNPKKDFEKLYSERVVYYKDIANIVITKKSLPFDDAKGIVIRALKQKHTEITGEK